MKLVSGWHNGITGPGALVSAAARYFNEDENNVNVDLQIETYPVVFEGTNEPAFHTSYCYSPSEMSREEAINKCIEKADMLVALFNKE